MNLPIDVRTEAFHLTATVPTVIEPGGRVGVHMLLQVTADSILAAIDWELPGGLAPEEGGGPTFPVALRAGETWQHTWYFVSVEEGYGELAAALHFQPLGSTEGQTVTWTHWISIFEPARADEREPLPDDLRGRLIAVVNARPQNGHIFLADHVSFFGDYLNISIPERLAAILSEDFGLPAQGLPVDPELYLLFNQGLRTFYGIEELTLIAEEECNESDDRFDPDELREATPPEVDITV